MKKIIGLSVTICLLISVMAGFGAFAAETTYYDINFDSWDINVDTTVDDEEALNPVQKLSEALAGVTGEAYGCGQWTVEAFSGDAKVSTVEWTDNNNVLKLEGAKRSEATNATTANAALKISIPYSSYNASTYDNDRLVAEYDVYIESTESDAVDTETNASQFYYTVFGEYGYNEITHIKKTSTAKPYSREFTTISVKADGTLNEGSAQYAMYDEGMAFNTWYKLKWVIDADTGIPYNDGATTWSTLVKTATLYVTNLSTGVTTTKTTYIPTARWAGSSLLLGGAIRNASNAMIGTYYVDNFKLYRQNKFAFESSVDKDTENVAFDRKTVSFKMNAPVSAASLAGITLKAGANTVDTTAALSESDNTTVVVTINEELDYSTVYTLDFSSVLKNDGTAIEIGATSFTFTTQGAPALYVEETKIYSGSDVYMTDETAISADGGLYTFAAKVVSSVEESKQATVIVGVYDASGKLVSASYIGKNIPGLSTETIAAGTTIPAELAGGKVKMFLWNNVNKMQPYVKPLVENID